MGIGFLAAWASGYPALRTHLRQAVEPPGEPAGTPTPASSPTPASRLSTHARAYARRDADAGAAAARAVSRLQSSNWQLAGLAEVSSADVAHSG